MKINVVDYNDKGANLDFRYRGTYLHGELEEEIGYDIFCFDRPTEFKLGAHDLIIEGTGRPATFFLWEGDDMQEFRGYLIYNDDEAFDFCERRYNDKSKMI